MRMEIVVIRIVRAVIVIDGAPNRRIALNAVAAAWRG
jgi:hypothetical protein